MTRSTRQDDDGADDPADALDHVVAGDAAMPGHALPRHAVKAALTGLRTIYRKADAAYAPFSCPASGECCQLATTQREPWLHLPEWLLLMERTKGAVPPARADGGCPFLDASGKRCSVYADRPLGCRTFFCGRVRGPSREPIEEMAALSKQLAIVADELDAEGAAPKPLSEWVAAARVPLPYI